MGLVFNSDNHKLYVSFFYFNFFSTADMKQVFHCWKLLLATNLHVSHVATLLIPCHGHDALSALCVHACHEFWVHSLRSSLGECCVVCFFGCKISIKAQTDTINQVSATCDFAVNEVAPNFKPKKWAHLKLDFTNGMERFTKSTIWLLSRFSG